MDIRTNAKKTCVLKEIGIHIQNMLTILTSTINMIGGGDVYNHLMSRKIFTLMRNKLFI